MRIINKYTRYLLFAFVAVILTACGGGNVSSSDNPLVVIYLIQVVLV